MYLNEFRVNLRPLVAACIGMAFGSALSHYTMSLFGPPLLAEFGWSKADFALIGSLGLINILFLPFAGRFVDRYGTRVAAAVGFTAMPLGFVALGLMTGSLTLFFTIWTVMHIFGVLTTTMVFARVTVEKFDLARGFALSLVMSSPPLVGAIAAPFLAAVIEEQGWRVGYFALAAMCALAGVLTLLFMERGRQRVAKAALEIRLSRQELGELLRNPLLILLLLGMFLVNVPQAFGTSQLVLVARDNGATSETATWMVSIYAVGVVVGRLLSGAAVDRISAHLVALTILGLPAFGYMIFLSDITAAPLLFLAIALVGFAQGAEGDLSAFLISRNFDMKNFSLLMSFMTIMIGLGSAAGSFAMSGALRVFGGYEAYLLFVASATVVGAIFFGLSGIQRFKTQRLRAP